LSRNFQRGFNILGLSGFIATRQQNHDFNAALRKVHAIARPTVNPHFRNAFAHRLAVAKVAILGAVDAGLDASLGLLIPQPGEPVVEHLGGLNGLHKIYCILWDTALQGQSSLLSRVLDLSGCHSRPKEVAD
jgi:hypothetical protein